MSRRLVRLVGVVVLLLCAQARAEDAIVVKMLGSGLHAYFAHDPARAITYLTSAIEGGTQDPRAYYFRGLSYLQMGAEEQAKGDFLVGAQLESSNTNAFFNVPRSLERVQGGERMVLEQYRAEARITALQLAEARNRERYEKTRQEQGKALNQQVAPAIPVAPEANDPTAAFQSGPVREPAAPAAEAPAAEAAAAAEMPAADAKPAETTEAPAAAEKPAEDAKPAEAKDMPAAPTAPAADMPAAPADDPFAAPAKPAEDKPAAEKPAEEKAPAADMPAAPADDPFATPAKPAGKPAADKPAAPADDPFAAPAKPAEKPAEEKPATDKPAEDKPAADTMDGSTTEKPADEAKPAADTMEMSSDQPPAADSKPAADEPAKPAAKGAAKPGAKLPNLPAKKADASDPFGGPAPAAPASKVTDPFKK